MQILSLTFKHLIACQQSDGAKSEFTNGGLGMPRICIQTLAHYSNSSAPLSHLPSSVKIGKTD